jgi:Mrr restriction endonuclease-like protein
MRNVSISDPVYQRLLRRATSFEDSPEDVIARLLDEAGEDDAASDAGGEATWSPSRATPGSILPVHGYWVPILRVLDEAGGSAPSTDVIEALEAHMQGVLTARDFEPLKSGEIRWRNRARFARLRMKERGLLSDTSHRGIWEITEAGREHLAQADERAQA